LNYPVSIMPQVEELAAKVSALLPNPRYGPLKVWGRSFGRPGENWYTVESCYANGDCLRFKFGFDEVLAVWYPTDVEISEKVIRIGRASAIRVSWYGANPKVPENIQYKDFALIDGSVTFRTNMDTVPGTGWLNQELVESNPAVIIGEN